MFLVSSLIFAPESSAREEAPTSNDEVQTAGSSQTSINEEVDRRFRSQRAYLLSAYGAVFLILFAYMAILSSRVRRLFRDVETIRRLVPPGSNQD